MQCSDIAPCLHWHVTYLKRRKHTVTKKPMYVTPAFNGRPDEVQIVVANSELAIARGDFEEALKILGDVRSESPAYTRVQVPNAFGARHKTVVY